MDLGHKENDEMVHQLFEAVINLKKLNFHPDAPKGLTHGDIKVLFCIDKLSNDNPDGVKVSDISKKLRVAPPTTTQQINGLVSNGYVMREVNTADRRAVKIKLSEKGEKEVRTAKDLFYSMLKDLVNYFGVDDSKKLIELVNKLYDFLIINRDDGYSKLE